MFKHIVNYFLGKGLPGIINFLAIAIYTRLLTPDEYGIYAVIISIVTLINTTFFHWLRMGLLRFNPKYSGVDKLRFLSSITCIFVSLQIFFITAGIIVYFFIPNRNEILTFWILAIILLVMQSVFDIFTEYLRSELRSKTFGIIMVIKVTTSLVYSILFINIGMGSNGIILGLICGIFTSLILILPKSLWGINTSLVDTRIIKEVIVYSLPFIAMLSMEAIIYSTDRFFINWIQGAEATGLYSVSYDLAKQILMMIMIIINLAAYPLVVKALEQDGIEACRKQVKINTVYLLMFSVPAMIAMLILSGPITENFLGKEFRNNAAPIFALITIGVFIQGIKFYYFDLAFQLGKNTKLQIVPVVLAAAANLFLNIILIPEYSFYGAAYSTIVSYILSIVLSAYLGSKVFKLEFPIKEFAKITFAAVIMGVVLWRSLFYLYGFIGLMLQVLLGLITYFIMMIILNIGNIQSLIVKFKSKITKSY